MPKIIIMLLILMLISGCLGRENSPDPIPAQPNPNDQGTAAPKDQNTKPPEKKDTERLQQTLTPKITEKERAEQKLREEISLNNWMRLPEFLKAGGNVNVNLKGAGVKNPPESSSLLIMALISRQPEAARMIIESPGVNLDVKSSSGASPLLLAEFFGYQELATLLQEKGQKFPAPAPGPVIIEKSKLDQFCGTLRVTQKNSGFIIHSPAFESFQLMSRDDLQKFIADLAIMGGKIHAPHPFLISWGDSPNDIAVSGKTAFIMINSTGDETVEFVVSVWEVHKNGRLQLQTVLDRSLSESYGEIWIREIHTLDKDNTLLIGESMGADGHDAWGSWWIGLWRKPRLFRLLHRERYDITQDDNVDNQWLEVHFEHSLDLDGMTADLIKRKKMVSEMWEEGKSTKNYEILEESSKVLHLEKLIREAVTAKEEDSGQ